jgi:hypothetical protein
VKSSARLLARYHLGLILAGLGACASETPQRPAPAALPTPPAPPGPPDVIRLDARWDEIALQAETEGALAGSAVIRRPSLRIFLPVRSGPSGPPTHSIAVLPEQLRELSAIDLERVAIRDGELFVTELGQGARPTIWLHELEVSLENAATRRRLLEGLPSLMSLAGRVQRTGRLSAFVTANPFGRAVEFSGRAAVTGLDLRELGPLLPARAGVRAPSGQGSLFMVFASRDRRIRGAVKILLENVALEATRPGFGPWLKAHTLDLVIDLFEQGPPERFATVVPIEGTLQNADTQVWPAVLGVLYNAFVQGLSGGYAQLPLERAPEPQSAATQAYRVLIQDKLPRTQPRQEGSAPAPAAVPPETSAELEEIPTEMSPSGLLRAGAERLIQHRLHDRGLLASSQITGQLDPRTREALARFQDGRGLAATGLPGYATVAALELEPGAVFRSAAPRPPRPAGAMPSSQATP